MNIPKNTPDSLSKYLAQAGIASRRKVVDIIKSKVVTVNGVMINEPGFKVNPNDCVRIKDMLVRSEEKVYILLNKPKNCITTVSDDLGRHNVLNLIASEINERVYPVGRLDRDTTGLLVLTNDGELALTLSHPRFEVEKIYHVQLDKSLTRADMHKIMNGLQLEDGFIQVDAINYFPDRSKQNIIVALHSGKNLIIRRIFEHLGYEVKKLDRAGYAGLTKARLEVGQWRHLTKSEINFLKNK
ncbi:MAG TPA: pseudouridine synthase [Candidatus Babeliales bacterium]|jgi:23S rRNA pseudouridine2605 synthase|nr:pseudouridine synthase [Candidatus Babeliales bacterium]